MPKGGRFSKSGKKRQPSATADVTLKDFADCSIPLGGRLKKSLSRGNSGAESMRVLTVAAEEDKDDLDWFEKDLEDFVIHDLQPQNLEEDQTDQDGPSNSVKGKKKSKSITEPDGRTYPDDLWHILSEFIHIEDIARFAGICRGANQVIHLSSFWRKLYYRLYKEDLNMPEHVKPASMERIHGLKARVVRSFFILYPPFVMRVQSKGPMEDEPHVLKGQRCLVMWHQPAPKGWQFCFKFQKPTLAQLTSRLSNKLDVYHGYNDLYYNPEEGCSVLQVTCCHFSSDAAVMGLLLTQVYVTLSSGFRHHRLRLHFDTRVTNSHQTPCDNIVVLDDVVAIKVFKWWHPSYPFIH